MPASRCPGKPRQTRDGWSRFIAEHPVEPSAFSNCRRPSCANPSPSTGQPSVIWKWVQTADSREARELVTAVAGQLGAHLENLRPTRQAGKKR